MPSFTEFDYFYAIDVLEIEPSWIALQYIWIGVCIVFTPILYVGKFRNTEYSSLFLFTQCLYVYSFIGKLLLASGCTQAIGLPNFPVYFFTGAFVGPLERGLTMLPSTILLTKMIPKGVESTLVALSGTIIGLN